MLKLLQVLGLAAGLLIEAVVAATRKQIDKVREQPDSGLNGRNLLMKRGKLLEEGMFLVSYSRDNGPANITGNGTFDPFCYFATRWGAAYDRLPYQRFVVPVREIADGAVDDFDDVDVTPPAASSSTPVSTSVNASDEERGYRRLVQLTSCSESDNEDDDDDSDVETVARVVRPSLMYQRVPVVEALAMVPYGVDPVAYVQAAGQISRKEADVERRRRAEEALDIPLDD